jgi:hypothetical protein
MLTDRIIGAFTFKKGTYAAVEKDTSFTQTAWILVAVVSFLSQLGSNASSNIGHWLIGTIVGTIFAVAGFALAAFVIAWVGRSLFKADVTFEELVRTLGLAYVWNVIGVVGALAAFSSALSCLLAPALFVGAILGLIAWLVAAKEALDLEWAQTIVTVIIGWIVLLVMLFIGGIVLGLLGVTARGVLGLFGGQ